MATLAELLSSPWTQQQAQGVADYKRQRRAYDRQEDYNFNQQNRLMEEARLNAIADRKKEEEELKQKAEEAKRNEQVYGAFDRYFYGLNPESRARYDVGATRAMSPQEAAALMSRIQGQESMLDQRGYSQQQQDEGRRYQEQALWRQVNDPTYRSEKFKQEAEQRAKQFFGSVEQQKQLEEQRRYKEQQDLLNFQRQAAHDVAMAKLRADLRG